MRNTLLAIDVGGSTSRAYVLDMQGECLGHGRNRGGNPASNTPDFAAASIIAAAEAAVADAGGGPFAFSVAQIALAGPQAHVAVSRLEDAFGRLGLSGPIVFAGDVLAMFASVCLAPDGYCVIAGTGAGAVRIRAGQIDRVVDLAGWLLGDFGSGYWLGQQTAQAAVADMEGRGPATALTPALLAALNIRDVPGDMQGRPMQLRLFIDAIYALRPIELARFAPLVFACRGDAIADRLLAEAEHALASDFATAFDPSISGPIALGGGVIGHFTGLPQAIATTVQAAGLQPDIRFVTEGSVGAAVLAYRSIGVPVDDSMFATIAASVAARTARTAVPV